MEGKKMAPPPHQHPMRQQQQTQGDPRHAQPPQYPHIHQPQYDAPPRPQQPLGPRSPLLENHQDLYGTRQIADPMRQSAEMTRQTLEMSRLQAQIARQPTELSRQYALREQNAQIAAAQRAAELQQRSIPITNSSYSMHSPTQDPILTAAVPPGYNASVHQAYLRRNRHLTDQQQIYQNHQSMYRPPPPAQQNRTYQPYTSRIQQPNYVQSPGHSHTQLLRQQYNELQQMKLHQQMQYQSQAQLQQQQTFAQRQILHQHLHSRQQSQQNLAQYGVTPTTAQINEVNTRLTQKQEANPPPQDEYSLHPLKNSQNQHKQNAQSPSVHLGSSPISKNSGDVASSPSTKSPSGSESRRSSSGTGQALRSPIAQRPLSAPVTKAGWLYKQGSDGLKVWRKRWFVLSEYCLFYYKGQEEDKLLGSVLLPSYQVSLCSLDDKVLKKYSFKCEHANMRTYILAAPDQEQMMHWMKVLTMAALMQEGSGAESKKFVAVNSIPNNTERRSKTPNNVVEQDEITAELSGGIQPTYENAPPKPRRSNEGYNSPSPDRSMDRYDPNYDILRDPSAYKNPENAQQKLQVKNTINAKSPQPSGTEALYESKSVPNASNYATQRHITKSPEVIYNAHNLSLPLTNTATNRLENNKSPMNYQDNRTMHNNNENRLIHNKSPAYFDSRNPAESTPRQNYQIDNQNVYGETGYQKMLNQQEMNKRIAEQYPQEHINNQIYQQHPNNPNQIAGNSERQSFERRTPDTYGRSVIVPGYYNKGRSGDYEDVYNNPPQGADGQSYAEQSYRRPLSPMAYEEQKLNAMQMQHQRYTPTNSDNNQLYQAPPVQMRQKKLPHNYAAPTLPHNNSIPRPHSADFLEYEAKNPSYDPNLSTRQSNQSSRQPQRPKSSLDINTYNEYNGDSYYYSEASYAEKMRQSAHYLRNKNFGSNHFNPRNADPKSPEEFPPNQRKLSMPTFRGNDPNMESSNYDSDPRIDGEAIYGIRDQNRNVSGEGKYGQSEITGPNSNWTLRNKSLTHLMGQEEVYNRSNSAMSEGSTVSGFNRDPAQMGASNGEQFIRSASARLPSTSSDQLSSREGERKVQQREESMKRLLEWKQRMLQSPLTRKSTPAALSLARSLNRHVAKPINRAPLTGSASQTFPRLAGQAAYNSYSSDDEERSEGEVAPQRQGRPPDHGQGKGEREGERQAGRSINSNNSPRPPPPPPADPHRTNLFTPATKTQPQLINPVVSSNDAFEKKSDLSHDLNENSAQLVNFEEKEKDPQEIDPTDGSDCESEIQLEYTDDDLDEILAQSDDDDEVQPADEDQQSGRRSVMKYPSKDNQREKNVTTGIESPPVRFHDYEICEINRTLDSSLLDDRQSENIKVRSKAATPTHETPPNPDICENHYLPMSPRKAVTETESFHNYQEIIKNISVFGGGESHEDNPYVEMSLGIGLQSAFSNEETQAYEIVCVNSGKVEPVYMELNNLPSKNVLDDKRSETPVFESISSTKDGKNMTKGVPPPKSILRKQNSESRLSLKSSGRPDVKSPLPDILSALQSKNTDSKSECSDADDEASKDFSLETAYSRFSLSDNFRPASYYLGSSGVLAEQPDSSDSELVSPPPIPTSPPPADETESSLDSHSFTQQFHKVQESTVESVGKVVERKSTSLMIYGNTPSMYDTLFKGERVKRNRASLPENESTMKQTKQVEYSKRSSLDSKSIPPGYKTSGNADSDSLLSYNADRGSSRMSMESDLSSKFDVSTIGGSFRLGERPNFSSPGHDDFIELRRSQPPSDSEIEKMLKRRPLSEESCFEIESLDSNFNETLQDINLDQYLDELHSRDIYLYTGNHTYPKPKQYSDTYKGPENSNLDLAAMGYLNDRVAAIREEVQYENINIGEGGLERSRSRNSTVSNTISDPDTVNTFQTVRPLSRLSNASGLSGASSSCLKSSSAVSARSASRSSLPIQGTHQYNPQNFNHTRHTSIEQPAISYYTKNTSSFDNDASILKNLNQSRSPSELTNKVNVAEMSKVKSSKSEEVNMQDTAARPPIPLLVSHSRESSADQSAPYYYSDLSSQDNLNLTSSGSASVANYNKNNFGFNSKLNNQRRKGPLGKKSDISHIHNPIHSNLTYSQSSQSAEPDEDPIQIAEAARCVSVEFLSTADKFADINHKNIYESDTLKRQKVRDSSLSLHGNIDMKNIYPSSSHHKTGTNESAMIAYAHNLAGMNLNERNKSLDQIIHNVVTSGSNIPARRNIEMIQNRSRSVVGEPFVSNSQLDASTSSSNTAYNDLRQNQNFQSNNKYDNGNLYVDTEVHRLCSNKRKTPTPNNSADTSEELCDGEMMWDEDSLWRENLRRVSHRHARSLDHLECLGSPGGMSGRRSVDLKTMLNGIEGISDQEQECKHRPSRISREVTYVNDNVKSQRPLSSKRRPYKKHHRIAKPASKPVDANNENDVYVQLASDSNKKVPYCADDGVYEQLATAEVESGGRLKAQKTFPVDETVEIKKRFEIDREKLRQWDLMSSGLMKGEGEAGGEGSGEGSVPAEMASKASSQLHSDKMSSLKRQTPLTTSTANLAASMSASMTGMENLSRSMGKKPLVGGNSSSQRPGGRDASIPIRAVSPRVREQPYGMQSGHESDMWNGQNMQQSLMVEDNWSTMRSPSRQSNHQPVRAVSPRVRRSSEVDDRTNAPLVSPPSQDPIIGAQNLSAGELLGRTHEELVLLLIQLRRKHSATAVAIEQCCTQIHSVQSRISTDESPEHRQENLQRLEQLRRHLADLERQYEKGRPLVHLVDNMVKLGTLYQRGGSVPATLDRLEHNQRQRERLLVEQAMEQRRWVESSECLPREQAEQKVEQLRALERLVAGEAGALRGLRRDRENLQRALGGAHLQHDLSRVHAMLAVNSKKLEQTVAGNARLEQELAVLRQKLQGQQYQQAVGYGNQNSSGSHLDLGPDGRTAADTTAMLEDELRRVQHLVGDLQKQRQELSVAVRNITDKSQTLGLVPLIPAHSPHSANMYLHQSLNSSSVDLNNPKKARMHSGWQETDLDSGSMADHGNGSMIGMAPLYIDTAVSDSNGGGQNSPLASDDTGQNGGFGNLTNVEKQEIKTVRIVKRESERRQRDRERSLLPGNSDWPPQHPAKALDQLMEEDNSMMYQQNRATSSLPRGFQPNPPQYTSYNSAYQQENSHSNSRAYNMYQKDSNQLNSALYQPRSHVNPPNTLSLTNVNIPFDNMSISSANSSNKFVSSPSLVNNNDYLNNHHEALHISSSRYGSYQTSNQILPLPTTNSYSMPKHSMSQSAPFLDSPVEVHRPLMNGPISPGLSKNGSVSSLSKVSAELSPVFTSEAARQIIIEMAGEKNGIVKSNGSQHRRQVPKEKRRHYTAPHHLSAKALDQSSAENDIFYEEKWWRARDDVDMERVLRASTRVGGPPPLVAPPDVVRSTLPTNATVDHYSEQTIDRLLAAPNKILIPERYIPEQLPELSPEEQKKRLEKVESIKKMLSSTNPTGDPSKSPDVEDKRQREHLLQLNQILAKQVMEMSKIVAVKALQTAPTNGESSYDSEDLSPDVELPLYQQRDNFFT